MLLKRPEGGAEPEMPLRTGEGSMLALWHRACTGARGLWP
jgi:hypothetical protein